MIGMRRQASQFCLRYSLNLVQTPLLLSLSLSRSLTRSLVCPDIFQLYPTNFNVFFANGHHHTNCSSNAIFFFCDGRLVAEVK